MVTLSSIVKFLLPTALLFLVQYNVNSQQDSLLKARTLNLVNLAKKEYQKIYDYETKIITIKRID